MSTRTIGVAIPIPEPYGTELQGVREAYGDPLARTIPTHITLMPPSEVEADDLETEGTASPATRGAIRWGDGNLVSTL